MRISQSWKRRSKSWIGRWVKNATNSVKLSELMKEKEETETTLEEKMDRWVYLNDLAEQIENQ